MPNLILLKRWLLVAWRARLSGLSFPEEAKTYAAADRVGELRKWLMQKHKYKIFKPQVTMVEVRKISTQDVVKMWVYLIQKVAEQVKADGQTDVQNCNFGVMI